jgi:hypothetical protein
LIGEKAESAVRQVVDMKQDIRRRSAATAARAGSLATLMSMQRW